MDAHVDELLEVAITTARAAGEVALAWQGRLASLTVEHKDGPGDLVSEADREAEQAARAVLAQRRPDDAVVGEEAAATAGSSGVSWYVDPVDGTTNFLYGRDDWCVSVAAWQDGEPVAAAVLEPVPGRLSMAMRGGGAWCGGVRRGGSAALALTNVALGRADAVWSPGLQPWDLAAGVLLVTEAGGVVSDLAGGPPVGEVLGGDPGVVEALRPLLQASYG